MKKRRLFFALAAVALLLATTIGSAGVAYATPVEGLTPGFWKNHTDEWHIYTPTQTFFDVFGVGPTSMTLLDCLKAKKKDIPQGSGVEGVEAALLRHAVAMLLNAADPDVNFGFDTGAVIFYVYSAYSGPSSGWEDAKNQWEGWNEL